MWAFLYRLASPKSFYAFSKKWQTIFAWLFIGFFSFAIIWGLFIAPMDYQQGDAYRIIYLHVPAAFLSLFIYSVMAFSAVLALVWQIKLASLVIEVSAPIGAMMTLLALFTGAIWGKPMWGTWWIWDARLTSELILFFIYVGLFSFSMLLKGQSSRYKTLAVLTLVGFIDLPIIHYSVSWWNTLHQGATLSSLKKPSIDIQMLLPLLTMISAFMFYYGYLLLGFLQQKVLWHEKDTRWVNKLYQSEGKR